MTKKQLIEKNSKDQLTFKFRTAKQVESINITIKNENDERRLRSNVWKLFQLIVDKSTEKIVSNYVRCSSCLIFFPYNGETTSVLLRHIPCNNGPQPLISKFLTSNKYTQFKQNDIDSVKEAAVKFVVKDRRPYYAVQGDGFIDVCKAMVRLGQKYPKLNNNDIERIIPSRQTVANDVRIKSNQAIDIISRDLTECLKYPGGFACTTDLWTDNFRRKSYLSITVHLNLFRENEVIPKMYLINMNSFNEKKKSGEKIFIEIERVFSSFGISSQELKEKVVFITDRGGNMRLAFTNLNRICCFAHIVNNIVQHMCKDPTMADIIAKAASLVRYVKITGQNNDVRLKCSLKSYCETRFNTVSTMLDSIESNYNEVLIMLSDKQNKAKPDNLMKKVTCLDQIELKAICDFLKLFAEITTSIEGDKYVTIHRTWPAFRKIEMHLLSKATDIPVVKEMKKIGRAYIKDNRKDIEPMSIHKLSLFLHPVLKSLAFLNLHERNELYSLARSKVAAEISLTFDENENSTVDNNQNAGVTSRLNETNKPEPNKKSLLFEDLLEEIEETSEITEEDEVQRYIDFKIPKVTFINSY